MSNLEVCPDCGHEVSKSALCCPNCGAKRKAKCRSKKGGFISLALIPVFSIIGGFFQRFSPDGVTITPGTRIAVVCIIGCLTAAAICFTAPSK